MKIQPMQLKITKRQLRTFLEKAYVVITLFMLTRPFRSAMVEGGDVLGGPTITIYLGLYLLIVPFVLRYLKQFVRTAFQDKLLMLLIGYVLVSIVWSIVPQRTLMRSFILLGAVFFAVYLAMRYTLYEQMQFYAWALLLGGVLSMIAAFAFPEVGLGGSKRLAESWQGIYEHKNFLGRFMTLSAILFWLFAWERKRKWFYWSAFAFSVFVLLHTYSATSWVVLVSVLGLLPVYRSLRWRDRRAIPVFITGGILIASIAVLLVAFNQDAILQTLGRDPTRDPLNGRTRLWGVVSTQIKKRPLLGYGYRAFWDEERKEVLEIWRDLGWKIDHAHNGYLEVWIQLGVIGLGMMLLHIFLNFRRGVNLLLRSPDATSSLWVMACLTFFIITNLTYSTMIGQMTSLWTLYVSLTLSTHVAISYPETSIMACKPINTEQVSLSIS